MNNFVSAESAQKMFDLNTRRVSLNYYQLGC